MAVRCTPTTGALTRATGLPAFGDFTMAMWIYRVVDTAGDESVWALGDSAAFNQYLACFIASDDVLYLDLSFGGGTPAAGTIATGTWYHVAIVFDNTANTATLYLNGTQAVQATGATGTPTWGYEDLSRNGAVFSGRYAAYKAWTAALTGGEVQNELRAYLPTRTQNLHRWTPLLSHTDLADVSGVSGVAWTGAGSLSTEAGPPIAWEQGRRRRVYVAAAVAGDLAVRLDEPNTVSFF